MYRRQPYGFKTCLLGRGFHIPIKNASFSSPTDVGSHNPPPWGPTSLLAHRSVSGSDAICNSLSSPLAWIIYFGPLCIAVSLTVLKCVCERCFHITLRNVSFSFSTDARSHSPWELLKNLWEYFKTHHNTTYDRTDYLNTTLKWKIEEETRNGNERIWFQAGHWKPDGTFFPQ